MPKIISDENIPLAKEAFSDFGEVHTLPGRAIQAEDLRDAEVLLVRSVTRVDESLLHSADNLRYVGTATIGTDHVDMEYLAGRGIAFGSAPGSNANSVAEYVVAALLELETRLEKPLAGATLGIVGVGNIGSIVSRYAKTLGMHTVLHDPPRAERERGFISQPRASIFGCDFVTLHVPMTKSGAHPTYHLVDSNFFSKMKRGSVLLNTSRGSVADNSALLEALQTQQLATACLDVWEGEPHPNPELVVLCSIATPHIAGYSFDAKLNATRQLFEAYAALSGQQCEWGFEDAISPPEEPKIRLQSKGNDALRSAMRHVYDIMLDDASLRGMLKFSPEEHGAHFDGLRKQYRVRREARAYTVAVDAAQSEVAGQLSALGFQTKVY